MLPLSGFHSDTLRACSTTLAKTLTSRSSMPTPEQSRRLSYCLSIGLSVQSTSSRASSRPRRKTVLNTCSMPCSRLTRVSPGGIREGTTSETRITMALTKRGSGSGSIRKRKLTALWRRRFSQRCGIVVRARLLGRRATAVLHCLLCTSLRYCICIWSLHILIHNFLISRLTVVPAEGRS